MSAPQSRQPAGTPVGGRFAVTARAEATTTLSPGMAVAAFVPARRPQAGGWEPMPSRPAGPDLITGLPEHLRTPA